MTRRTPSPKRHTLMANYGTCATRGCTWTGTRYDVYCPRHFCAYVKTQGPKA